MRKLPAICRGNNLNETKENILWSAGHDGYLRLKDPVLHKREVTYLKKENQIIIRDQLACKRDHKVECFFQLHPDCSINERANFFCNFISVF